MKKSPLVSVIIPAYNSAQFLTTCLDNVINQTYNNLEVLLIDDGSTDNTEEVVLRYQNYNVKYIHQKIRVLLKQEIQVLNFPKENIFYSWMRMIFSKNYIETQVLTLLNNTDYNVSICKNKLFSNLDNNNKPITYGEWPLHKSHYAIHILRFNLCPPHCLLYKRSLIQKIGLFNSNLTGCEDYDFLLRAFTQGAKIKFNPLSKVYYRRHPGNRSNEKDRVYIADIHMHEKVVRFGKQGVLTGYNQCAGSYACLLGMLVTYERLYNKINDTEVGKILTMLIQQELARNISMQKNLNSVELKYLYRLNKQIRKVLKLFPQEIPSIFKNDIADKWRTFRLLKSYLQFSRS